MSIPVHLHFVHWQGPAVPVSMMVSMTVSVMGKSLWFGCQNQSDFSNWPLCTAPQSCMKISAGACNLVALIHIFLHWLQQAHACCMCKLVEHSVGKALSP